MDETWQRRWARRDLVRYSLMGAGAVTLGMSAAGRRFSSAWAQDATPAGTPGAGGFDAAACYQPFNNAPMVKYDKVGDGPFNIGLSNSYIGNVWRTQMIKMAKAFAEEADIKPLLSQFQVNSSGQDDAAQIAAIENMISNGAQAIIINANSPTALIPTVEQARADGIVIVAFDNVVESDKIVTVNEDQVEMGRRWAQFLVDQMGAKGKVLMVNGVPGTSVDNDRRKGAYAVFKATAGMSYVEVEGDWDPGKAQDAAASALAANPDIAGIWCQGGTDGVVRAFQAANKPIPPIAGEAENGFRKQMYNLKLKADSIGQSPGLVAVSIRVALDLLQGNSVPRAVAVPLPEAKTEDLKDGVNVFLNAPDNFFTPIQIPACGVTLTYDQINNQQV